MWNITLCLDNLLRINSSGSQRENLNMYVVLFNAVLRAGERSEDFNVEILRYWIICLFKCT